MDGNGSRTNAGVPNVVVDKRWCVENIINPNKSSSIIKQKSKQNNLKQVWFFLINDFRTQTSSHICFSSIESFIKGSSLQKEIFQIIKLILNCYHYIFMFGIFVFLNFLGVLEMFLWMLVHNRIKKELSHITAVWRELVCNEENNRNLKG